MNGSAPPSAVALALSRDGHFEWEDFRQRLIATIGTWEQQHGIDDPSWNYYDQWLAALEASVVASGLATQDEIAARAEAAGRSSVLSITTSPIRTHKEPVMHIEVGILSAPEVAAANATAIATLAGHARALLRRPHDIVKALLAAVFFSLFMQVWHQPVGPSELHFIGASMVYFMFGFIPTMFGFALGPAAASPVV